MVRENTPTSDQRPVQRTLVTALMAGVVLIGPAVVGLGQAAPGEPVEDDLPGWAPEALCGATGERVFEECPRWASKTADHVPSRGSDLAVTDDGSTVLAAGSIQGQGVLVALDAATGQELWRQTAGPADEDAKLGFTSLELVEEAGLVIVAGTVVAGDQAPAFATHAYDVITGELVWSAPALEQPVPEEVTTTLVVLPGQDRVVVGGTLGDEEVGLDSSLGAAFLGLELATGQLVWQHDGPAVDGTVIAGSSSATPGAEALGLTWAEMVEDTFRQNVVHVDAATGDVRWARELIGYDFHGTTQVHATGTAVYAVAPIQPTSVFELDPLVLELDPATGETAWAVHLELDSRAAQPGGLHVDVAQDRLLVPAHVDGSSSNLEEDVGVFSVDASTGEVLGHAVYDGPDGAEDTLYATTLDDRGCLVMAATTSDGGWEGMWTLGIDASTLDPVGSQLYRTGPLTVDQRPHSVALGPDGSGVYLTGEANDAAGLSLGALTQPATARDMVTLAYDDPCATTG